MLDSFPLLTSFQNTALFPSSLKGNMWGFFLSSFKPMGSKIVMYFNPQHLLILRFIFFSWGEPLPFGSWVLWTPALLSLIASLLSLTIKRSRFNLVWNSFNGTSPYHPLSIFQLAGQQLGSRLLRLPGFLCLGFIHFDLVCYMTWASYLTLLCFSSFICKMGILIIVLTSRCCSEGKLSYT